MSPALPVQQNPNISQMQHQIHVKSKKIKIIEIFTIW